MNLKVCMIDCEKAIRALESFAQMKVYHRIFMIQGLGHEVSSLFCHDVSVFLLLVPTVLSYTQAGIFTTKLSYEELKFKFTTYNTNNLKS